MWTQVLEVTAVSSIRMEEEMVHFSGQELPCASQTEKDDQSDSVQSEQREIPRSTDLDDEDEKLELYAG